MPVPRLNWTKPLPRSQRPDALLIGGDPFYLVQRQQSVAQVASAELAAVYQIRDFTDAGGLMSDVTNIPNPTVRLASMPAAF